jgi:hypothetical protein
MGLDVLQYASQAGLRQAAIVPEKLNRKYGVAFLGSGILARCRRRIGPLAALPLRACIGRGWRPLRRSACYSLLQVGSESQSVKTLLLGAWSTGIPVRLLETSLPPVRFTPSPPLKS